MLPLAPCSGGYWMRHGDDVIGDEPRRPEGASQLAGAKLPRPAHLQRIQFCDDCLGLVGSLPGIRDLRL